VRRSFRSADAPDAVIELVRRAKMDPEHDHLNDLMS
jgi:hypothetical protein